MKEETTYPISVALTSVGKKENRRALDYYPTPKECTVALMEFISLPKRYVVWEPACGEGHMSNVLKKYFTTVVETDIVTGTDFLLQPYTTGIDAVITNPPFNLAEKFIRHSITNTSASVVAMLLKSQYWHAKIRLPLFNEHTPSWILPLTWRPDFYEHEREKGKKGAPNMDMIWSVWLTGSKNTKYQPLRKPTPSTMAAFAQAPNQR